MATKVFYVKPDEGIMVRSTAAGSEIARLNVGDLMYDWPDEPRVTAALNGTSYTWVKVTYYSTKTTPQSKGNGWVALENLTEVSATVPSKANVVSTYNTALKQHEMLTNARYIHSKLKSGWKFYAICAMLGNMEQESTINPNYWQNGTVGTINGYGLVQWSPSSKYITWILPSTDKENIDKQIARIQHEVDTNDSQWDKSLHSPQITFSQFTQSTQTVNVLAEYFLRCYERCTITDAEISKRHFFATKWSSLIGFLL